MFIKINFDELNIESLNKAFNVNISNQAVQNNQTIVDLFHQQVKLPKLNNIISNNPNGGQPSQASLMSIKQEIPSIVSPVESTYTHLQRLLIFKK